MTAEPQERPIALVADDDELMRLMLSESAASAGFDVLTAANGVEALSKAEEHVPDIILLDVNMPVMDGFSACDGLRASEIHRLTPIVVVTGDDDSESIDKAFQCGATDFISKPINWSLLAHRLRYILRSAQNLKALDAREEKIHRLAYFDDLTGLPNRARLREAVEEMAQSTGTGNRSVALIHLDLHEFKRVNDSFGHKVGDKMLSAVGRRLCVGMDQIATHCDVESTVARVGGDEFIAAISARSISKAATTVAEKWIECLQRPFLRDGNELHMTPSIGIAYAQDNDESVDTLFKNASSAMHASKQAAPGTYVEFCDSMKDEALNRVQLESALREALRLGLLEMHYQPKYSVESGDIAGLEALLRWHDYDRGWVSPIEIISLAEECGLILDINRYVVDSVCSQLGAWRKQEIDVPVAINVSATEFLHGDVIALIREACDRHDVDPCMLEVEITESTLLHDVDGACAVLRQLKAMGVRVSVDDFGTGYSSLAYLKRFDIDLLKIDRSFINGLGSNAEDHSICQTMLALAKSLSLGVVAEGVETFEQHSWLAAHDCDYVQGYLWSKPLDADAIMGVLVESSQQAQCEASAG